LGVALDTVATLKALSGANLFNGLAHVVMEKSAWYVYKSAAVDADDGENFITPNTGAGRWVKCNGVGNRRNTVQAVSATEATTTLDFALTELILLELDVSTTINLSTTFRSGYALLAVSRVSDSQVITGYDARVEFSGTPFAFASGITTAIFTLYLVDNVAYVVDVKEYS
jgi:hypothetical protein